MEGSAMMHWHEANLLGLLFALSAMLATAGPHAAPSAGALEAVEEAFAKQSWLSYAELTGCALAEGIECDLGAVPER
jgi:hypothetical protein